MNKKLNHFVFLLLIGLSASFIQTSCSGKDKDKYEWEWDDETEN